MNNVKFEFILVTVLLLTASCSLQRSTLGKVGKIDTVEEAEQLSSKNPQLESEILQLDSADFYSHPIYKSLRPGLIYQIGNEPTGGADIYKLLEKSYNGTYNVFHIRISNN